MKQLKCNYPFCKELAKYCIGRGVYRKPYCAEHFGLLKSKQIRNKETRRFVE